MNWTKLTTTICLQSEPDKYEREYSRLNVRIYNEKYIKFLKCLVEATTWTTLYFFLIHYVVFFFLSVFFLGTKQSHTHNYNKFTFFYVVCVRLLHQIIHKYIYFMLNMLDGVFLVKMHLHAYESVCCCLFICFIQLMMEL